MANKPARTKQSTWTIRHNPPNISVVSVDMPRIVGSEFWMLLRSDVHWDNPDCRRDVEIRHLREAVDRNAVIVDAGDLFCAMQGKYDKRSDKGKVREEHRSGDYLDTLVRTAADYCAPFAKNMVVIGRGNHETSISNRHETDLTARLTERLNDRTGSNILAGGYSGFVVFKFECGENQRFRKLLWYHHGYGGGGPVTKDIIQAQRQQTYVDNADIMLSGHVHEQFATPYERVGVDRDGDFYRRRTWYLKTPTYKEEYKQGQSGWHIETGKGPKPIGAWWMRCRYTKTDLEMTPIPAE